MKNAKPQIDKDNATSYGVAEWNDRACDLVRAGSEQYLSFQRPEIKKRIEICSRDCGNK